MINADGTMTLSKGQVEYLTSLFHLVTDRACQLLATLHSPEAAQVLEEGTIDHIAHGLVDAFWRIRWEMDIPLPEADPANGDRPEQSPPPCAPTDHSHQSDDAAAAWRNIRVYADSALRLIGTLPTAVAAIPSDGGEFIQEVITDLSTDLYCLSNDLERVEKGSEAAE